MNIHPAKIGIMGGGQLAQMLGLSACSLGMKTFCLEADPDCPAACVTEVIVGDYSDEQKLKILLDHADVLTYEFENIPAAALSILQEFSCTQQKPIYPSLPFLEIAQNRYREKCFFKQLDIPTTQFMVVENSENLIAAIDKIGFPCVLKTCRWGYDGKGQYVLRNEAEALSALNTLTGQSLLLENHVPFECEVSCIAARDIQGNIVFYPLTTNHHHQGILRVSRVSSPSVSVEKQAQDYVARIMNVVDYIGVLAVEFFYVGETQSLIANEMAPRVHNSGHWSIEGAITSQFENHIRAITGLPLGLTTPTAPYIASYNLIGNHPPLSELLKIPGIHCHLYGKNPRPGRKLGHVTICTHDIDLYQQCDQYLHTIIEEN